MTSDLHLTLIGSYHLDELALVSNGTVHARGERPRAEQVPEQTEGAKRGAWLEPRSSIVLSSKMSADVLTKGVEFRVLSVEHESTFSCVCMSLEDSVCIACAD
jgi:hypothetical protein